MSEPIDPNALPVHPGTEPPREYAPPPPFAPPVDGAWGAPPPFRYPYPLPYPDAPPHPYPYPTSLQWDELAPQPRRTSPWIWALAIVAVLLAGAALLTIVKQNRGVHDAEGTAGRTLVLPTAVDGYSRMRNIDMSELMAQLAPSMRKLGVDPTDERAVKVAIYSRGVSEPTLVFIGIQVARIPRLQDELDAHGVEASVRDFSTGMLHETTTQGGAVIDAVDAVSAGPLGGFMRCGMVSITGHNVGMCGWGDRSVVAASMLLDAGSTDATAGLTRDFRAVAER